MTEPRVDPTEYHDEYSETLGTEFRKLEDALLSDTVGLLASRNRSSSAKIGVGRGGAPTDDRAGTRRRRGDRR